MKFSKVTLATVCISLFAVGMNVSFAKAKDHDGEIIAYMQAINNSEINTSKVAKDKKIDSNVMNYADMMIQQHGENLQQVTDLSAKLNIPADETSGVKNFKKDNEKKLAKLSKLDGVKFQKKYINEMIIGHTKADHLIIKFEKKVNNEDLKQYLMDTQKTVEKHLAEAKELK